MAGKATIKLVEQSKRNFDKQMDKLAQRTPEAAAFGFAKFLGNAKILAQQKLKADDHIITSRLRNSIYIKTGTKVSVPDNGSSYSDNEGFNYDADFQVDLTLLQAAIGTNVEYAGKIELLYDSFLFWGIKNSNPDEMGREIAKRLLKGIA